MPPNKSNRESLQQHGALVSHLGRQAAVSAGVSRLRHRKNTQRPPVVMTWRKAIPTIVVAVIFDLVRIFFEWFWFLGPALGAVICTAGVNSAIGASIAGTGVAGKVVAAGCSIAAAAAGTVFSETTIVFGTVMAEATAAAGWLTVGLLIFMTNRRIFKQNGEDATHVVLFYISILLSFIPIIGTIPTVSMITYKMFKFQIKIEREALKKYEEEQAAEQLADREQQFAEFAQQQNLQAEEEYQDEDEEIPELSPEAA